MVVWYRHPRFEAHGDKWRDAAGRERHQVKVDNTSEGKFDVNHLIKTAQWRGTECPPPTKCLAKMVEIKGSDLLKL